MVQKVEKRDVIKAPLRKTASGKIKQCERRFEDFARMVYERTMANG